MWQIWKNRNEMVFKGLLTKPMEGVNLVRHQLIEFRACHNSKKQVVVLCEEGDGAIFAGQSVRWRRPNYGVLKINCDGARCRKTLKGGYGWVMRDFAKLLQAAGGERGLFFNNVAMVEVAAIRATLMVCIEMSCDEVEIEFDSRMIISMLNGEYVVDATLECFIHDIGQAERKCNCSCFSLICCFA
ncbi:hypothetical protein D8674_004563 [Pyrus ussuriensis x Pyrus communis]|uniref:RNase H type-1 domain-containing protein n=1 Tax=Pyrus ussuriensis x Pyrus communis TaxID=2448454 RepID=A0A5N5FK91_9ROSA|nr:hypothetical protein D8674_004563 [Pyrus ussuriensis x Pyrus communis]